MQHVKLAKCFTEKVCEALLLKKIIIIGGYTHPQRFLVDNDGQLLTCSFQEVELLALWGAQ